MAIKVNSNTAIDDSKNVYLNNVNYTGTLSLPNGYSSGGATPTASSNVIDTFPFASPWTTATDVGDLSLARFGTMGTSSSTNGYASGGKSPAPGTVYYNTIDTFPFSSPFTTATDYGDLAATRADGAASYSTDYGYAVGGSNPSSLTSITRYPFSSPWPGTSTNVGDLAIAKYTVSGQQSATNGYAAGGYNPPATNSYQVDTWPFSSPFTTATDAGDLVNVSATTSGQSSDTYGYTSGGYNSPFPLTTFNYINRFPFSAPFIATDYGDISQARANAVGQSSSTDGYTSGGYNTIPAVLNTVDKFPFSAPWPGVGTDSGNLSVSRMSPAGHEG